MQINSLNNYKEFLFQIGAIKSDCASAIASRMHACFYSKLVRLKEITQIFPTQVNQKFLFQIGAIKSFFVLRLCALQFQFLFQIGAIKSCCLLWC